jgi:hypothetical protein
MGGFVEKSSKSLHGKFTEPLKSCAYGLCGLYRLSSSVSGKAQRLGVSTCMHSLPIDGHLNYRIFNHRVERHVTLLGGLIKRIDYSSPILGSRLQRTF